MWPWSEKQAVEARNLTVSYRSIPAVHHVDACFEPGQAWAIFGPNGAGKSTLLKALMRLLPCDTGSVLWPRGLERKDLAYLPQQSEIDRSQPLSAYELVALGLWHEVGMWGGLSSAQHARVRAALDRVDMGARADAPMAELSRGQFQRLLFARMLVQDAHFLLLDEPFAAMDERTTAALLDVLHECRREGRSVVAVVHDRAQALAHFDHALLLARECIASGPCEQALAPQHLARAAHFRQDAPQAAQWCDMDAAPQASSDAAAP